MLTFPLTNPPVIIRCLFPWACKKPCIGERWAIKNSSNDPFQTPVIHNVVDVKGKHLQYVLEGHRDPVKWSNETNIFIMTHNFIKEDTDGSI